MIRTIAKVQEYLKTSGNRIRLRHAILQIGVLAGMCAILASGAKAQTNVTTQHMDISRSGANTNETILTPANVNSNQFGKLFSYTTLDGFVYAEPLYMSGVKLGSGTLQAGTTHNVVFVATEHDSVYAFDADSNGGANAAPLWQVSLIGSGEKTVPSGDLSTGDIVPEVGITGTPVIDPTSNTIYVIAKTTISDSTFIQRLHALDITTGLEKFGGPVVLSGSVAGTGNGSSGGVLKWDPKWENNRPGLLLLNGIVYMGFAAHGDQGPWHGWILAYNASTLKQTGAYCTSPNGGGSGVWMSGSGLAADVIDAVNHPYGRMFIATGNGTYDATTPYTNNMDYGDDHIRLDLTNGVMTVQDSFTPSNQSSLNGGDTDVASGGILLLPDQSSGGHTHLLVQVGKEGKVYVVDRDTMSGYNSTDKAVQEISGQTGGLWSMPAYWNNSVYFWGSGNYLKSFSVTAGKLSTTPTATGTQYSGFPGTTPTISANGTTNAIAWGVQTDAYGSSGNAILWAFNASSVGTLLYGSNQNAARDAAGPAVKFMVPTVVNGKVYVGTQKQLNVYGLLNGAAQTAAPVISPVGESFTGTVSVSIMDSTSGATIYYTLDGSMPSTNSTKYTGPITVSSTETVTAIAGATGDLQSTATSQTYTLQTQTLMPTFTPVAGSYSAVQTVTLTPGTAGSAIYYTTDGSTPSPGVGTTQLYSTGISVGVTTTIRAIATFKGLSNSPVASSTYTITLGGTGLNYSNGFSTSASTMTFNGSTGLDDSRLQLTSGVANQAGSAFYNTPVNIQSFTTDFSFQLSNPAADGFTFTIQGNGPTALGPDGGGLGYGPDTVGGTAGIGKSVAVKFDLYSNAGEGIDSTGMYTNGVSPTVPSIDMTSSGIDLHSDDAMSVHLAYDGTTLSMTITDAVVNKTFTTSWTVNIPSIVGGNTAYVGFTGGTGGQTSSQKILTWTLTSSGGSTPVAATPMLAPVGGTYTLPASVTITDATVGSTIYYTTNGNPPTTSSTIYNGAFSLTGTTTVTAFAVASGYTNSAAAGATYTIQVGTPILSPGAGTYGSAQSVTITDTTAGSAIYYTTNGSTPTPGASGTTLYAGAIPVSATTTIIAIATATGQTNSAMVVGTYTITTPTVTGINFGTGFTQTGMQFNGHTKLNGSRLQLTDTTTTAEVGSAFWNQLVNVQSFTNDFTFQLTTPNADGITFTLQGTGATAIGPGGGGLGYGPDTVGGTAGIGKSVAVKFDLYSNSTEGTNSTGLYTNGVSPTTPATTLGGGVNLHSGDIFKVHMTYDGTTLTMTITDTVNTAQTFTTSWPINIPATVGGNTAYVGFTGGTGGSTATQEILTWSYGTGTAPPPAKTPVVYASTSLAAVSSGPTFRQFTYASFPDGTGTILDATNVGDNVTFTVNVATAGTYDVKLSYKQFNTRGISQLSINGANVGSALDQYIGGDAYATADYGNFAFATAGSYLFKFTITGKNASSSGYSVSFDDFTLTPQ
jgi:Legume lectin domain/Chitobiase/beta-hexosaminidase C-terminal domain/Fn3 associated